jgi:DNA modification methylase
MDKLSGINQSIEIEQKLIKLINEIAENKPKEKKDITFYWSKKSPEIAAAVYKLFTNDLSVILDPFIGSGSSLKALQLFKNKLKFVGIDVNQLPIELARFNIEDFNSNEINQISEKINLFIQQNRAVYDYYLDDNQNPYIFKKAILDRRSNVAIPTQITFELKSQKINLSKEDGPLFDNAIKEYLRRQNEARELNSVLSDLTLVTNSRIAIKSGMKLSEIFSPLNFNVLLKYRENAMKDMHFAIILSSCLHLCRLTDTRSQSQFPYWVPKVDAVDRNVFDLLNKKITEMNKIFKSHKLNNGSKEKSENVKNYAELKNAKRMAYFLINSPIQKIGNDQIEDDSIDLVFTDPPYFDQVAYSEYLVIWEFFTGIASDQENEIIQSNRQIHNRNREDYLRLMKDGFLVISNKLKLGKFAIIYFKDSKLKNIADFLQIMESVNLEYLYQIHVPKSKFTYKQNTSQEGTVEGDSLYVFRKTKAGSTKTVSIKEDANIDAVIVDLIDEYLNEIGQDTPSKILDNFLIPRLWEMKVLHLITDDNAYQKLIKNNYRVDKESRKIIGRI